MTVERGCLIDTDTGELLSSEADLRASIPKVHPVMETLPVDSFTYAELHEVNTKVDVPDGIGLNTRVAGILAGCWCCECLRYLEWFQADKDYPLFTRERETTRDFTEIPGRPEYVNWTYDGNLISVGTDDRGLSYEYDKAKGFTKRVTSFNERKRIAAYAKRYGANQASAKYDIPASTIRNWVGQKRR